MTNEVEHIENGEMYRQKLTEYAKDNFPDSYISEEVAYTKPCFGIFHNKENSICPRCGRDIYRIGDKFYCIECIRHAREAYHNAVSSDNKIVAHEISALREFALDLLVDKVVSGDLKL